tara:strand:+ start:61 stop:897 length:837 start_codon:yes stop_codon:yes gene_type:complete
MNKEKMEAMWFWKDKWRTGTRDLTPRQKGFYIDMLCESDGKGLPKDIKDIYRLIFPFTENLEDIEEWKKDVHIILGKKYKLDEEKGRYVQLFQEEQHSKGVDLKVKRRNARLGKGYKKEVLLQQKGVQKDNNLDIDIDIDIDSIKLNKKAELFSTFWELNRNKIQVGDAKKAWVKLPDDWVQKPEELARLYNNHFTDKKDFSKHPSSWLNAEAYLDQKPDMSAPVGTDQSPARLKMFQEDKISPFLKGYAVKYEQEVREAVSKNELSRERAEELGINT